MLKTIKFKQMRKTATYNQYQKEFRVFIENNFQDLVKLKEKDDKV